jgi:type II secretory pathway component GspD/PulD (secretin)
MKRLIAILVVALLLSCAPVAADSIPGKVDLEFEDADLVYVLKTIAKQTGVDVLISPEVDGSVTISVKDKPGSEVLPEILKDQHYEFRDGILLVGPQSRIQAQADQELKGKVTLEFVNCDLSWFLRVMAREAGLHLIAPNDLSGSVTVTAKERNLADIIPRVLAIQETDLDYEIRNGMLLVAPKGRLEGAK